MTREVAARRGYRATYMGRPDATSVGSGLHVNMSLVPVGGGANALRRPDAADGLSALARQAIGGLIHHHEAVAGLSAPLVNSYKRLMPGSDRRVLGELGPRQPLQHVPRAGRAGCADAHREPDAVRHGEPVPGRGGDAQRRPARRRRRRRLRRAADRRRRRGPNTDRHTPHTLAEALDAIEADTVLAEAMGPDLVAAYLALRRHEIARWEAAGETWDPEQISAWELDSYLKFY